MGGNEEGKIESEEPEEPKETPKRVTKLKRPKVRFSPEEIETRYQAHLEKIRGGKKTW